MALPQPQEAVLEAMLTGWSNQQSSRLLAAGTVEQRVQCRQPSSPPAHGLAVPSTRAGRHIGPVALARRLRTLGIEPVPMRLSALNQFAAELPPGILSSMLGLRPTTAARWVALAGGNWTHYASDHPQQRPDLAGTNPAPSR